MLQKRKKLSNHDQLTITLLGKQNGLNSGVLTLVKAWWQNNPSPDETLAGYFHREQVLNIKALSLTEADVMGPNCPKDLLAKNGLSRIYICMQKKDISYTERHYHLLDKFQPIQKNAAEEKVRKRPAKRNGFDQGEFITFKYELDLNGAVFFDEPKIKRPRPVSEPTMNTVLSSTDWNIAAVELVASLQTV